MLLSGSLEDNVLTALCWSERLAPKIAERVTARDFTTQDYQRIATVALGYVQRYGQPPRVHLADLLEAEVRRRDSFIAQAVTEIATRLGPQLNEDYVEQNLDDFLVRREMDRAISAASDFLIEGDTEKARLEAWKVVNARPPETQLADPWSDPVPPPFDLDLLAPVPVLRNFVRDRAETMGADPVGLLWAAISTCSAAIDGSTRLQMKENDWHYQVPPGIWTLLFGEASTGRTPILETAWRPLERLQNEQMAEWKTAVTLWGGEPRDTRGPKPHPVRYIVQDTGVAGIQNILTRQNRGVARFVDEWAGIIGQMMAFGGGSSGAERAFFLQSFDGTSFFIDRVGPNGRGDGYTGSIRNNHIVHCGGVQPDRLQKILKNIDLTEDGFLQRFHPLILRPMIIGTEGTDDSAERQRPRHPVAQYHSLIEQLTRVPGDRLIRLDSDALGIRKRVERRVFELGQNRTEGAAFATYVRKLTRLWGSLTLLLGHVLDLPAHPTTIGAEPALLAERLMDYVLQHAIRFYRWLGGGGDRETMQSIAGYLLAHPRAHLVVSDLTRNVRPCRGMSLREAQDAVSPLIAMDWLRSEGEANPRKWAVNQLIYSQFAERAQRELYHRRQIHELIRGEVDHRRAVDYPTDYPTGGDRTPINTGDNRDENRNSRGRFDDDGWHRDAEYVAAYRRELASRRTG